MCNALLTHHVLVSVTMEYDAKMQEAQVRMAVSEKLAQSGEKERYERPRIYCCPSCFHPSLLAHHVAQLEGNASQAPD